MNDMAVVRRVDVKGGAFDPATILHPSRPPSRAQRGTSLVGLTVAYVQASDEPAFELTDLLGYAPATWAHRVITSGLLWRTKKTTKGRRYWIVKKGSAG